MPNPPLEPYVFVYFYRDGAYKLAASSFFSEIIYYYCYLEGLLLFQYFMRKEEEVIFVLHSNGSHVVDIMKNTDTSCINVRVWYVLLLVLVRTYVPTDNLVLQYLQAG